MQKKLTAKNIELEKKFEFKAMIIVWLATLITTLGALGALNLFGFTHWISTMWVCGLLAAISLRGALKTISPSIKFREILKLSSYLNVLLAVFGTLVLIASSAFGPYLPDWLNYLAIFLTGASIVVCFIDLGVNVKGYQITDRFILGLSIYTLIISLVVTFTP
ncbi:hypothetical protein D5E80_25245 [Vibrio parahaemolyticus]|nr:hypothetical protein D5E80_25245 [Vibrio parahaemolyticus]